MMLRSTRSSRLRMKQSTDKSVEFLNGLTMSNGLAQIEGKSPPLSVASEKSLSVSSSPASSQMITPASRREEPESPISSRLRRRNNLSTLGFGRSFDSSHVSPSLRHSIRLGNSNNLNSDEPNFHRLNRPQRNLRRGVPVSKSPIPGEDGLEGTDESEEEFYDASDKVESPETEEQEHEGEANRELDEILSEPESVEVPESKDSSNGDESDAEYASLPKVSRPLKSQSPYKDPEREGYPLVVIINTRKRSHESRPSSHGSSVLTKQAATRKRRRIEVHETPEPEEHLGLTHLDDWHPEPPEDIPQAQTRDEQVESDESEEGGDDEAILPMSPPASNGLFEKAKELFHQSSNWTKATKQAENLERRFDPNVTPRSKRILRLKEDIEVLCSLYEEMSDVILRKETVNEDNLLAARSLVENLLPQVQRILDKAKNHALLSGTLKEEVRYREDARRLANELQTHIIPLLVKAAKLCLAAHFVTDPVDKGGLDELEEILNTALWACDRVYTLWRHNIIYQRIDRNRYLRRPLRGLVKAFQESKAKYDTSLCVSYNATSVDHRQGPIVIDVDDQIEAEGPSDDNDDWTEEEVLAILDGLRLFQGPDRYNRLIRRFGTRLRGRTITELRVKALHLRRQYLEAAGAEMEAVLQTEKGRRTWAWLIDVR